MDAGLHSTAERVAYNTKQPILYDRLSPVLDIVVSVNSRAYLAEVKVHQAFLMLLMLLKELEFQHGLKLCSVVLNDFSACFCCVQLISLSVPELAMSRNLWNRQFKSNDRNATAIVNIEGFETRQSN